MAINLQDKSCLYGFKVYCCHLRCICCWCCCFPFTLHLLLVLLLSIYVAFVAGVVAFYRYWFEGVAVLLGTHLPILLFGMWLCRRYKWWSLVPMILALWVLFFHSLLTHKEHRFIFPVLPLANIYVGK